MYMAISIEQPPTLNPLITYTDKIPEERWGKKNAEKFIQLLKKFYIDTKYQDFFKQNEKLYKISTEKFLPVYNKLDVKWYEKFYGKEPKEKFVIVNGLGNGGGNYGPNIEFSNGDKTVYAIMGTWRIDSLGFPDYEIEEYLPTLLHEFNHSFVNYLTEKNRLQLKKVVK